MFDKVTVAAELALSRALPALLAGNAPRIKQDASASTYYGGRKPEDGTIDWSKSATAIHNLVRAVAPPYPGARSPRFAGRPARVLRTRVLDADAAPRARSIDDGGRRSPRRALRRRRHACDPRAGDRRRGRVGSGLRGHARRCVRRDRRAARR